MAQRHLAQLQQEKMRAEPQTIEWSFPFVIKVADPRYLHVRLDEAWENENLLYLDFDDFLPPSQPKPPTSST